MGEQLGRRYLGTGAKHVLPKEFSPDLLPSVWAHADNLHRTLNTLRGVLGGLWPAAAAPNGSTVFPVLLDEEVDEYVALYCASVQAAGGPYDQQGVAVNAANANTPAGRKTAGAVARQLQLTPNFTDTAPPFNW